ncbi:MAG TPA: prolyl oligopeptidase family serine peptidase, partial [Nannocystaceae bacterium]|nr:prolyl oligopeptidase family serine peptidase [Nannocystaceae bacterium]
MTATAKTRAACGSWPSPLTPARMAESATRLSQPWIDDHGRASWIETRPHEGGRSVLVERDRDGVVRDLVGAPHDVRSRVHEYGGAAYTMAGDRVLFVDATAGTLACREADGTVRSIGGPQRWGARWRLAEPKLDRARERVVATGERLREDAEPEAAIVAVDLATGALDVLVRGADFYAAPALDDAGERLAFLAWNHPHMPWDAATLFETRFTGEGRVGEPRHVAGDANGSAFQPGYLRDGALVFVWERDDRWQPFVSRDGRVQPLASVPGELGLPLWSLGVRTWGVLDEHRIAAAAVERGRAALFAIDVRDGAVERLATPWPTIGDLATARDRIAVVPGWGDRGESIELLDGTARPLATLRCTTDPIAASFVPEAEPIEFATTDDAVAHGFFYAPKHPEVEPLPGERPPLVVLAHGGPTGGALAMASPTVLFFTTRGFAVLDVNYRGSTGYGRSYREALRGRSGIVEVDDVVAGARALAEAGRVDANRLAIRGASAGGYIALAAVTFSDAFRAAAIHYGISDV